MIFAADLSTAESYALYSICDLLSYFGLHIEVRP